MTAHAAREPEDFFTLPQYLAMEAAGEIRHEWVAGRVIAMSGGSRRHDLAAAWIANRCFEGFTPQGCAVFRHNRKLRTDAAVYYPDDLVHCGRSDHDQFETTARFVVEVLSPDSAIRDRREKAAAYAQVKELEAYLVVDPDQARVEVYAPEDGSWIWRVHGPGMQVPVGHLLMDVDTLYDYIATFVST